MGSGGLYGDFTGTLAVEIEKFKGCKKIGAVAPGLYPDLSHDSVGTGYLAGFDKLYFHKNSPKKDILIARGLKRICRSVNLLCGIVSFPILVSLTHRVTVYNCSFVTTACACSSPKYCVRQSDAALRYTKPCGYVTGGRRDFPGLAGNGRSNTPQFSGKRHAILSDYRFASAAFPPGQLTLTASAPLL